VIAHDGDIYGHYFSVDQPFSIAGDKAEFTVASDMLLSVKVSIE
jgi:hypothetical protein